MADMQSALKGSDGIAFLVSAGIVYEIIAAACSSPQTTEINASARADTLMKWVHLGVGQAAVFIVIAAIIGGGALAAGLMYMQYAHAKSAGLKNGGPPTESYGGSGAWGRG